jgi:hypothetical protein
MLWLFKDKEITKFFSLMNKLPILPILLGIFSGSLWETTPVKAQTVPTLPGEMIARNGMPPAYPSFNSQRLNEQLFLYQQMLATSGSPDILIVGSSRALQGVDPIALQQGLAHQGYPGLKIYNFSVNGATAQVIDLVVRKILLQNLPQNQLPRLIIFADGVRAFNSGRVDRTYEAIVASPGYQMLLSGGNPLANATPRKTPTQPTNPSREYTHLTLNHQDSGNVLSTGYQAVNHWFSAVSTVVTENYQRQKERAIWFPGFEPPPMPTLETAIAQQSPNLMQPTGFIPVTNRYDPTTYYQNYPRVPGLYDGDYSNFNLEGTQKAALSSLITYTKAQGIPFVFVNLPLNQDYLADPLRQSSEQQFRQMMVALSQQRGFIFRDLGNQWPGEHGNFADPSHLNRYGAFAVSLQLAQDETIPWANAFR